MRPGLRVAEGELSATCSSPRAASSQSSALTSRVHALARLIVRMELLSGSTAWRARRFISGVLLRGARRVLRMGKCPLLIAFALAVALPLQGMAAMTCMCKLHQALQQA